MAGVDARFQQRPQSGHAGPVADQQQGAIVGGDAEAGIGAHAQVHHAAGFDAIDQPAAAEAGAPVGMEHAPHQQLQAAVVGHRGDRVLAAGEGGAAGLRTADRARTDLGHVAGFPAQVGRILRDQRQVPGLATGAAGIEQAAFDQPPRAVVGRAPIGDLGMVAERSDLVLPVAQRRGILVVDLDAIEQRPPARPPQALVQLATEAAEALLVIGVAKGEHGVLESVQVGRCFAQLPCERAREVGGFAVTVGRDHEQHPCMPPQLVGGQ